MTEDHTDETDRFDTVRAECHDCAWTGRKTHDISAAEDEGRRHKMEEGGRHEPTVVTVEEA